MEANTEEKKPKKAKTEWNEDIYWYVCDAAGLLGEKGLTPDPGAGGPRTVADNGPYHLRMIALMPHVDRWRRLHKIWTSLRPATRAVLELRYTPRKVVGVVGAEAAFGALAPVAIFVASAYGGELRRALREHENPKNLPLIDSTRRATVAAIREAHLEWNREVYLLAGADCA